MGGVPVVGHLAHELKVLVSEKELVLPILLVFQKDLLLDWVLWAAEFHGFGCSRLALLIHHGFNLVSHCCTCCWPCSSCHRFCFLCMDLLLVLSLVDDKVRISPLLRSHLHHTLAGEAIIATKALVFKLVDVKVADGVIVELVPALISLLFVLTDEGIVVTRVCSSV